MKKHLTTALAAFLAVLTISCCRQAIPIKSEAKETVRTEYIEKIRIDTMAIELPQESKSVITKDTVSHLKIAGSISSASIYEGLLFHSLKSDPAYKPRIEVQVKEVVQARDSLVLKYKEIPVNLPRTTYEKTMIWIGWASLAIFAILSYRKIRHILL